MQIVILDLGLQIVSYFVQSPSLLRILLCLLVGFGILLCTHVQSAMGVESGNGIIVGCMIKA